MENESNMKKSVLNDNLPRYYKGYDVDSLIEKSFHQLITGNERVILNEIISDYYDKEYERVKLSSKKEVITPLMVNGKELYHSGTMINNPFMKPLKSSRAIQKEDVKK